VDRNIPSVSSSNLEIDDFGQVMGSAWMVDFTLAKKHSTAWNLK